MSQHFLLSAAARTLSLSAVARMSDEEAHERFVAIRWADNGGQPYCPECGCAKVYAFTTRKLWKCSACRYQFSVTARTIFQDRKRPIRDYLLAIAIFVNGAKGHSALQLSRDLDCQYKTAFVLAHKLREAIGSHLETGEIGGEGETIEVDGAYFGGKRKPENRKADRIDRRHSTEGRQVVVIARERHGRTIPWVVARESDGVPMIRQHVATGTVVHADESSAWERLHASYDMRRVNHSVEFMAEDGACTNQAESFFSRLRRSEFGIHHRIAGPHLDQYAREMAWREDHRRQPNGMQFTLIASAALRHPVSDRWCGYWQRSAA
jgi:ribosomal protein L37AE/L43A/transposase-like protein